MDRFSQIDAVALLEAGQSLRAFGVTKAACAEKGYDQLDILWAFYCLHADHSPQVRMHGGKWDGGYWGHMEKRLFATEEYTYEADVYTPNISRNDFREFAKDIEAGRVAYFPYLAGAWWFPEQLDTSAPWANIFA